MSTSLKVYQVETTNACNLTCDFCPKFTDWNKRRIGFMKPVLVDYIDWSATEYTEVQFTGEPTLHKQLNLILLKIKGYGVKVGFSTNGTFKDRLESALDIADLVTVNDDDFRDPVFQDRDNVIVQQLGVTYQIEDYSRTKLVSLGGELPECTTPFTHVSVQYNGDVVPCCKDHSGLHVLGNVYEETLEDIEHGEKRKAFLDGMMAGKKNGMCEYCCAPNPHKILDALEARLK